jgi:hypothetical protein
MNIKDAKYMKSPITNEICAINCTIDGAGHSVPLVVGNAEYDEIQKQVKEGTLTIKDAE